MGDWGGIMLRQGVTASLDYVDLRFGGGEAAIDGGRREFNALEILQADVRVTNSSFVSNADGINANADPTEPRVGRGNNDASTIFIRGAQPIIANNTIVGGSGAAISINPDALNFYDVVDTGRSTGEIDLLALRGDNQGPLIIGNELGENAINGMRVRGEIVTTDSVWDDTDIVHVVEDPIYSLTHHYYGALRLRSEADQSLVVKFDDDGTLVGGGRPLDIDDRVGGTLQILGAPGFPVVLTSIHDCFIGAGFTPDGLYNTDTINSGACAPQETTTEAPPFADIIVVMDESGTMGGTQAFTAGLIQDLETALLAAGVGVDPAVGENRYGAVGFASILGQQGRSIPAGPNGELFGSSDDYVNNIVPNFSLAGATEDGYAGIDFALSNYTVRPDAAKFIILATDEDRDILNPNLTLGGTITSLQAADFNLQALLNVDIADANGQQALAIDNNQVYTFDGGTGFTTAPGGQILFGAGSTLQDYVPIPQATDGIVADINLLAGNVNVANAFGQVLVTSIVEQVVDTGQLPAAGDWTGLQLQSYANDRNVAYVFETERAEAGAIGTNASPAGAQRLGILATGEYSGDENERLGITVRGALAAPQDVDTYRFDAAGGTAVTFDIDETTAGLDTVIELVTVDGEVIVRSDNSFSEALDNSLIFTNELGGRGVSPRDVRPIQTGLSSGNVESPNHSDAGVRVVLPGDPTEDRTYYVRVLTAAEKTSGAYELSINLGGADEVAGSTIQGADIRFATTAIDVTGTPLHSPLTGDVGENVIVIDPTPEDPNSGDEVFREATDTRLSAALDEAQPLGNLLTSDRGSLVVSGEIGNLNQSLTNPQLFDSLLNQRLEDVDVYRVDLFAQQLEPDTFDNENRYVTTTFDIDYAGDELGRVNTVLSVFDSQGRLILIGRDSNIADDQGRPTLGVDMENLDAGSAAVTDAYIGPVELPEGTYYVAVSSEAVVPEIINQFFEDDAEDPNVRLYPVNSTRRISRDSMEEFLFDPSQPDILQRLDYNAEPAVIVPNFGPDQFVPYQLEDVRLFVSYDSGIGGGIEDASLASFNPFTGTMERLIGETDGRTQDIAIRRDGELFSYRTAPLQGQEFNNANVGTYLNVSPVDGSFDEAEDDALTFRQSNQQFNGTEVQDAAQFIANAITMTRGSGTTTINRSAIVDNTNEDAWVVGNRDASGRFAPEVGDFEVPLSLRTNILFNADAETGEIRSFFSEMDNAHRTFPGGIPYNTSMGPASNNFEFGVIDTGLIDTSRQADAGSITGIAALDNNLFGTIAAVTDQGGIHTFDPFTTVPAPSDSSAAGYESVIPTQYFGLLEPQADHNVGTLSFTGLTAGPQAVEGGVYGNTLFATTVDGWLYAFNLSSSDDGSLAAEPAHIFVDGRYAMQLTFVTGAPVLGTNNTPVVPTGLAFSNLEFNPWQVTNDRDDDIGHEELWPHDLSRARTGLQGGNSLYFGFQISEDEDENTYSRPDDDPLGELAPGGSHGSILSEPMDLSEYTADDLPTLYFTYNLEVEEPDDFSPFGQGRRQRDSVRVFGAGDDGIWRLLATNDAFQDAQNPDEYDRFFDPESGGVPVQTLYDDSDLDQWRQVRTSLAPLAGSRNARIRFDFSTSGNLRTQFGSIELVARDGDVIEDNALTILRNNAGQATLLQSVVGQDLVLPAGDQLVDGQTVIVDAADGGGRIIFEFVPPGTAVTTPIPPVTTFPTNRSSIQFFSAQFLDSTQTLTIATPGGEENVTLVANTTGDN
ncbi:MAG: hypothetical protein AAF539_12950, partial [Planctomycetota bacterium]